MTLASVQNDDTIQFSPELLAYFATRDDDRRQQVESVLAVMTKREQALVREIAVMANVVNLPYGERPAKDTAVLYDVIARCISMPDLYPTIARLARIAQRRSAILHTDGRGK